MNEAAAAAQQGGSTPAFSCAVLLALGPCLAQAGADRPALTHLSTCHLVRLWWAAAELGQQTPLSQRFLRACLDLLKQLPEVLGPAIARLGYAGLLFARWLLLCVLVHARPSQSIAVQGDGRVGGQQQ